MMMTNIFCFMTLLSFYIPPLCSQSITYSCTGNVQNYVVPQNVVCIYFDIRGASGGADSAGGLGARVQATLSVSAGTNIYIYIGSAGVVCPYVGEAYYCGGGWNGGGDACGGGVGGGYGGGGASDVRIGGQSYNNRVIVAGGGGGSGGGKPAGNAGEVGSTGGASGGCLAGGATQSNGGFNCGSSSPSLGIGGNGACFNGGGGGGGFYGGGGGADTSSGGGGSSFSSTSRAIFSTGYQNGNGSLIMSASMIDCSNPSSEPTLGPTGAPSTEPSLHPSEEPTTTPSNRPSCIPTLHPTQTPSSQPSMQPSAKPTDQPSSQPTICPTTRPSNRPSGQPSSPPSSEPSAEPSCKPTTFPTCTPSSKPSRVPSTQPVGIPSSQPTSRPSFLPSAKPTTQPTTLPSSEPSIQPSSQPSGQPSNLPSGQPSSPPSSEPSAEPSCKPTTFPTCTPSSKPSRVPSTQPVGIPSSQPTSRPSFLPSAKPTTQPTTLPSSEPSIQPSSQPSGPPSNLPSGQPSSTPSSEPSAEPSCKPTTFPTCTPSSKPSRVPSTQPVGIPSSQPTSRPSFLPSAKPTTQPTTLPSSEPSIQPSSQPSGQPTNLPSGQPSSPPSSEPSAEPSCKPTTFPTCTPSSKPSRVPSTQPVGIPSSQPTSRPSFLPSAKPTTQPTTLPSSEPSIQPSSQPTRRPSLQPVSQPSGQPSNLPSGQPSSSPSSEPSAEPSVEPSCKPTTFPTFTPSSKPTRVPSTQPVGIPSSQPTSRPSFLPSAKPTAQPATRPFNQPTSLPTIIPSSRRASQPTQPFPNSIPIASITSKAPFRQTVSPTAVMMTVNSNVTSWREVLSLIGVYLFTTVYETFTELKVLPMPGLSYILFGSLSLRMTKTVPVKWPVTYRRDLVSRVALVPGDLNQDRWNDLFLCNPIVSMCYIFYGTEEGITSVPIGATICGTSSADYFGFSIASAGDMNKDRNTDMIVCALRKKACYVLYGGSSWPTRLMISEMKEGYQIIGDSSIISLMGLSVAGLGDMNDDGYNDIAISVLTSVSSRSNIIYVIFGTEQGEDVLLSTIGNGLEGFQITGEAGYYTGLSISGVGDVNDDGFADLAIGKLPYPGFPQTQSTIIIFGNKEGGDVSLSSYSDDENAGRVLLVEGGGFIVSGIGDINHDGIADVLLSASYDYVGESNAYIVTYPTDITSPPTLQPSSSPSSHPSRVPSGRPTTFLPSEQTSIQSIKPLFSVPSITTMPSSLRPNSPNSTPLPSERPTHCPSHSIINPTTTQKPVFIRINSTLISSLPPSVSPSRRPSLHPSFPQSSSPSHFLPSSLPSSSPAFEEDGTVILISGQGQYFGSSSGKDIFNIQGSGNIEIVGGGGTKVYIIFPPTSLTNKTVLTITDFEVQRDMINLQHIPTIHSVNEISFSENPLTMYLTKNVKVICSSLSSTPPNRIQFIFASSKDTNSNQSLNSLLQIFETPVVIMTMVIFIALVASILWNWNISDEEEKSSKFKFKDEENSLSEDLNELFFDSFDEEDEVEHLDSDLTLEWEDAEEGEGSISPLEESRNSFFVESEQEEEQENGNASEEERHDLEEYQIFYFIYPPHTTFTTNN